MENTFTSSQIEKMLFFKQRKVSLKSLYSAEAEGKIPKASRKMRGKVSVRHWSEKDLPEIGKRFGFLENSRKFSVISFYTAKGGVLKSTLCYNFARTLALNGLKVLVVGLDVQQSITDIFFPQSMPESLDGSNDSPNGLYEVYNEHLSLSDVIKQTSLTGLDVIPENPKLHLFAESLTAKTRREDVFSKTLIPLVKDMGYDVVLFDNSPSWNTLIQNSLACSDVVISPVGCDLLSYRAYETNLMVINKFFEQIEKNNVDFYIVPTLLEKRVSISNKICSFYLSRGSNIVINCPIRRSAKGQEATGKGLSSIEYDPKSDLASDYHDLITSIWQEINVA